MNQKKLKNNGKPRISIVEKKSDWGIYVWMCDFDSKPYGDGNGNILNIPGRPYDLEKMSKIRKAAEHYGAPAGKVSFMAGVNRVTDEEHSAQIDRMKSGLIPSETDIGAWMAAEKGFKKNGR
jgi:hypothetical protein